MYSYNPYYEKYLAHYGVKHKSGRYPWGSGERPYQGDDAFRRKYTTESGHLNKRAYKKLNKAFNFKKQDKNRNIDDYTEIDDLNDKDIVIKKGTEQYRVTNAGEKLDNRHKYLSNKYDYENTYGPMWELLKLDPRKDVVGIKYTAKSDLKIANAKQVLDYTLNTYLKDDKKVLYQDFKYLDKYGIKYPGRYQYEKLSKMKDGKELRKYILQVHPHDIFENNMQDILEYFSSKGYAGIQDINDTRGSKSDPNKDMSSAIILNTPIKYLKQESETKIHQWW